MNVRQHLPVCVGVYPNRIEVVPAGMAYDRAKIACDALKGTYSSSCKYFSDDLNEAFEKKQYILENFDRALSEGWIHVYYQPIMRAISKKVCNDEALARWIDPVKGSLSPADFIPHLEDAGLIYKLDLYVLDRVLENIREQEAGGCTSSHTPSTSPAPTSSPAISWRRSEGAWTRRASPGTRSASRSPRA